MNDQERRDLYVAIGAASAFVLFGPRVGGAVSVGAGLYYLAQGRKVYGGATLGLGAASMFLPEIMSAVKGAPTSEGRALPAGLDLAARGAADVDIGGGWTMLDARAIRDEGTDAKVAGRLAYGETASLLLEHGAGARVFNAQVIGIEPVRGGWRYGGKWVGGAPAGGPQAIDFDAAHVFAVHR